MTTQGLIDKNSITYKLQKLIWETAKEFDKTLKIKDVRIEHPAQETHGDYATNIAMALVKKAKKPPMNIAEEIIKNLPEMDFISRVEVAKPGFINFWLNGKWLCEQLIDVVEQKEKFGKSSVGKSKKIMVEFAHPNTHKPFHIGHLRNIILGESISRIIKATGVEVIRANYQGDVGLHIAKCLYGLKTIGQKTPGSLDEKIELLGRAYVLGNEVYEKDEDKKKKIENLNVKIYEQAQTVFSLWQETKQWSLDYFDRIYKRVYVEFDRFYFESEVAELGKKIVLNNLRKNIFEKSEGAIIFDGEKHGFHKRVFINRKGLPTYEAKDMGLSNLQFEEYDPDLILHVVGPEQQSYFQVVFKALEMVFPKSKDKEYHRVYGWVRLKKGKMASRLGNVVLGEWLLDRVKKRLSEEFKIKEDEKVEAVTVGAVKYSMLKLDPITELVFDIDESISTEGDSGPYLQYTYARARSVLRKAKILPTSEVVAELTSCEVDPEELAILRTVYQFPEVVLESARSFSPNLICHFLFDLAQKFNAFYNQCPILDPNKLTTSAVPPSEESIRPPRRRNLLRGVKKTRDFRLLLTASVAQVLKNGLTLLGIKTLEEM